MIRLTERDLDAWHAWHSPEVEIVDATLADGPIVVLCAADTARAKPYILEQVERIKDEVDAIMIMCFCDPAVEEAREIAEVPIVGLGESSMFYASQRARRFSIATVVEPAYAEEKAADKGYTVRLASVHRIEVEVPDLLNSREATVDSVVREMVLARDEHGAEAVLLGCAGLSGLAPDIEDALGIPCIDPIGTAFKSAEVGYEVSPGRSPRRRPVAASW
jgi:allantoin racemase